MRYRWFIPQIHPLIKLLSLPNKHPSSAIHSRTFCVVYSSLELSTRDINRSPLSVTWSVCLCWFRRRGNSMSNFPQVLSASSVSARLLTLPSQSSWLLFVIQFEVEKRCRTSSCVVGGRIKKRSLSSFIVKSTTFGMPLV